MKKLMIFLLVLVIESAYTNTTNLQKIPAMINRVTRHPEAIANFNNVIHILDRASKSELTAYLLEGSYRDEIDDPMLMRRVERVVKMKISDRTDGEILDYLAGWQDGIGDMGQIRIPEIDAQVVERILLEGTIDEINLLLYVVKDDPALISENQLIELINRGGLEDGLILIEIVNTIGRSEYWAKKTKWVDHFFGVIYVFVGDDSIKEALKTALSTHDDPIGSYWRAMLSIHNGTIDGQY